MAAQITENNDLFPRSSGVLLHVTSLPGQDGIGDLGESARRFVDWLEKCGQSLWQVLPLGPTSYGDSPYQTLSALAGNPLLISLDDLVLAGWLSAGDLNRRPSFSDDRVDFGPVIEWKSDMLERAWQGFQDCASPTDRQELQLWREANAGWLDDFALFKAIKLEQGGAPWLQWPGPLAMRESRALGEAKVRLSRTIDSQCFVQWLFFTQWQNLKAFASARGVRFVGDLPIFVALDSCDVWANREYFRLDDKGQPTHVAGVPPDYFSETGQLWGNPLYDWDRLKADRHAWWVARLRGCLDLVDLVRIDHFRGFEAYWEVPADQETAVNGRWVSGPGAEFFEVLRDELGGQLPVIAEDLGVITPEVEVLRDGLGLPGMKILQFAWSGPDNLFLPHEYVRNCVVYSGTHDNDPTLAWWKHLASSQEKDLATQYVGCNLAEPHWTMIRLGVLSVAHTFIATMQDVLGLGREARMNLPGEGTGNWNWRMPETAYTDPAGERLARLTYLGRRRPDQIRPESAKPLLDPSSSRDSEPGA
ncbi:MAG: 4-alpha-glucanotransferase [Gemmatimonadales bacterium]|nr:4-alpha-glucanotransferase [Gemmatimonadales bacterium]